MENNGKLALLVLLILLAFSVYWCFLLWLISRISGWSKLARKFSCQQQFSGTVYAKQWLIVNSARYKYSIGVGINSYGIYLQPMKIFSPWHRPLLIPWQEITAQPFESFLIRGYQLKFKSQPDVSIKVLQSLYDKLLPYIRK